MPSWLIGSSPRCDLVVEQPTVAGHHCLLTRTPEGDFLEDLGTPQGTFVNSVRVEGRVRVHRSDLITLGSTLPMPGPPGTAPEPQPAPKAEPKAQPAKARAVAAGREPEVEARSAPKRE